MAAPAAAQQTAPPAGAAPPAEPPKGDSADARLDRVEATQREQGAVLGRIEQLLRGGRGQGDGGGQGQQQGTAQPSPGDIAAQVRQEIADADQRRQAEEDERTWKAGVNEVIEKVKQENAPREPETGVRARLQRWLVGKEPG
jgi:hypothetical protein